MEFLCFGFFIWLMCGIIGAVIGGQRGQAALGFVLGFLLGPIGVLIAVLLPAQEPPRRRYTASRSMPLPGELPAVPQPGGNDWMDQLR